MARSKLGAWKKGERIPATFKSLDPHPSRRVSILDRSDEQPARASIAQIGASRRAEDYFAAMIMTDVLGQQALKAISGHEGTTVETSLDARLLAGPLTVSIKSAPANLAADLDAVIETMTRMQSTLPASEAVESAKARMIASMAERLKTTAGAGDVILDIETYGLGRDYVIRFADRANSITPADVQRAAQAYLKPQSIVIAIAGSAAICASYFSSIFTHIGWSLNSSGGLEFSTRPPNSPDNHLPLESPFLDSSTRAVAGSPKSSPHALSCSFRSLLLIAALIWFTVKAPYAFPSTVISQSLRLENGACTTSPSCTDVSQFGELISSPDNVSPSKFTSPIPPRSPSN